MSLIHLNTSNFEKEVLKSDIPVIIDFWADWCAPCKMMAPVFEELSRDYEGKLKFAKLNTDENPELAATFGIRSIPTLMIMEGGEIKGAIVGFAPKPVLKAKIDQILQS